MPKFTPTPRRSLRQTVALALGALALPLALSACGQGTSGASAEAPPLAGAAIGGPFSLLDKDGKTVNWSDFNGKYRIVYFGYTFCPDACPMDLQALMHGFARFEKSDPNLARQVQPIFISIDPARDTQQVVGEFTAAFHPRLLGLTGSPEAVSAAAKAFAAYYAKGQESAGGYLMDHSRTAFLMDREGKPIVMLDVDKGLEQGSDDVDAKLKKWVH